ncbi:MAG: hypothetical protein K6G17_03650 [Oscillospiraceae bacterium]|nr:hypothetical protein [Oscillospiraceae bacterium]
MKKTISLVVALVLALSLSACGMYDRNGADVMDGPDPEDGIIEDDARSEEGVIDRRGDEKDDGKTEWKIPAPSPMPSMMPTAPAQTPENPGQTATPGHTPGTTQTAPNSRQP